ncbi:MAG TPA: MotA/TolQ/ExbB proton channel family protein [Hyphomicrobiaceae bacterium]|nr:MotA/TolQ/ExbB proton channel family protein [Hyphomicrobiaceae bacterium]
MNGYPVEHLAAAGRDFSIYGLVMHADPVVKGVLVILVLASIACWAIILEKAVGLVRLGRELKRLDKAASEDQVQEGARGLVRSLLTAAAREADDGTARGEGRSRLERAMRSALRTELKRLEFGLPFLATVGSAAPFVGLFGTVWGIMNSFTSIAQAKDTSLAVVAPGIAEALLATALGLAAAIPAVVAYNQITVSLGRAAGRAGDAITEIARRISRPETQSFLSSAPGPLHVGRSH